MTISIVTPSLNQLAWLRLAVASVADQDGAVVEHIVQDALSDDGTKEWLTTDGRAQAYFEKDSGMYDAINRGLRRTSGDICAYLNCDEQYLPGTLRTVGRFFESHPSVDILFGDIILIDRSARPLSYRRTILPEIAHLRGSHLNTSTCSTFFRRGLLERGFYFDTQWRAIGDTVWVDKLLRENVKMATLQEPLAVFAFTGENLGEKNISREEGVRWTGATERSWRSLFEIVRHRIRKAQAGAYWRREVAIDVFTHESPTQRVNRRAKVGFRWPDST